MTSCELPHIQISDPGELIETVPYLLGFHPRESLVLIGFAGAADSTGAVDRCGPQQIQVTVRLDLPDRLPGNLDAQALQPLGEVLRRAESAAMAAVLVTDSVPGDPRRSAALVACRDLLAASMDESGIEVLDVLVATERRWWSLCCEQPGCCPSDGHERVLGCSAAAAQATVAGLVALPDRQALVATLAGSSTEQRSALLPQLADAVRRRAGILPAQVAGWRRAELADMLAAAAACAAAAEPADGGEPAAGAVVAGRAVAGSEPATGGGPGATGQTGAGGDSVATAALTGEQVARYAVALTDLAVRDALWLALDDGGEPISRLMGELHVRLPAPYDAAPLFLFGWSQWRAGNATLAMMAAERVLETQPGYSAATLLLTAAQRGLDPRTVPALGQGRAE